MNENNEIVTKIVDNIRALGIDMINEAKSGHPGIVLGAAPIIGTLFANHIKVDQKNDKWINRDRFIMSAGHGSALLYATLFMSGYNIPFEELKNFRKLDSLTPGHPEYGVTPGVDMTTGPLGQGIASSVGFAISERFLRNYFGDNIINYYTYVLCGDGDLMEGISYEAASLAGHLNLNKLIVLYDSNSVTLDGPLNTSYSDNVRQRFESMNWNYILVDDGEDIKKLDEAIESAKQEQLRPTIIEIRTVIGKYSQLEGKCDVHGSPLKEDDIKMIKTKLGIREIPFAISQEIQNKMIERITNRNSETINSWYENINNMSPELKEKYDLLTNNLEPIKLFDIDYKPPEDGTDATRNVSGKILNSIAKTYPFLIGGSADVSNSTKARIKETEDNTFLTPGGRNINFGIREAAMGAIANGIALSNLTPFVSTFYVFSDYLKPALRLTALMNLPVIYVFTHDSIGVGEDGPTHQPIEQLASFRALPNFDTYRPCDANETIGAYKAILSLRKPAAIVLGRNKVKIQENTSSSEVIKGAYIIEKELDELEAIIITSGEELELAMDVHKSLQEKGYGVRLVSMPSMSRFEQMDEEYQNEILPKNVLTFVIEKSASLSWYKYTTKDNMFTIDSFGASGNRKDVDYKYGFDKDLIEEKIKEKLNNK